MFILIIKIPFNELTGSKNKNKMPFLKPKSILSLVRKDHFNVRDILIHSFRLHLSRVSWRLFSVSRGLTKAEALGLNKLLQELCSKLVRVPSFLC